MINWVAYAVALHLRGDYEQCLDVLQSIYKLSSENKLKNFEMSELVLYNVLVLLDFGKFQQALELLTEKEKQILDHQTFNEFKVKALRQLGRNEEAAEAVKRLIETNPNNLKNYNLLLEITTKVSHLEYFLELEKQYPKIQIIKYQILKETTDETQFKQRFQEYILPYFR